MVTSDRRATRCASRALLRRGTNSRRALAPGVHFLKEGGAKSEEGGAGIRKVVVTR